VKLKGGSIIYTIFIALLMFSAMSSFILASYHRNSILIFRDNDLLDIVHLKSAINLGLSDELMIGLNKNISTQLYKGGKESDVTLSMEPWGLYNILKAEKQSFYRKKYKIGLIGNSSIQDTETALYLADKKEPLSLCGSSRILGKISLPNSGIKKAFIEGQEFIGTMPNPVNRSRSKKHLPLINSKLFNYLISMLNGELDFGKFNSNYLETHDTIVNNWENETVVIKGNRELTLDQKYIKGKIIVFSDKRITIDKCLLDGPIFVAPEIEINNGVKGNAQFIASQVISLDSNSKLQYPSSLCLISNWGKEDNSQIKIGNGSQISGDIFLFDQLSRTTNSAKLLIGKKVVITGLVYANGSVEHKGTINGTLYCQHFFLKTPYSTYSNHLLNASIDRTKLPEYFISSLLIKNTKKGLIKWLN